MSGLAQGCLGNRVQCLAPMGIQKLRAWQALPATRKKGHCPFLTGANGSFLPCSWGPSGLPAPRVCWNPGVPTVRHQDPVLREEGLGDGLGLLLVLIHVLKCGEKEFWIQKHPLSYKMA